MGSELGTGVPALVEGELVDDRSLDADDADDFGHADFVGELAGVICRTRTPANIALFGPWGSGKSGIANLLQGELPKDKRRVRFVTFDASKYAEAPLRRHFISQVAHGLTIADEKYHRGLYTGIETRDVRFRAGEWGRLALAFLASAGLALAVLLAIATLVAAVSAGPFEKAWSNVVKDYLLATLPVAAVIAAFVKLAADGFHTKTTRTAPSGDEEFEARFRELVGGANTDRLVVFIDELDRCSPAQVASTLETLKTFLFIEGCVFVVAADQQVLEQALRRKVRQHTPEDTSNPYYSAGSSYLDKVFQYQLTLPPLKAPTLSRFALGLVDDLPGVWQRVTGLDEVVSVLIPTHVVSPRRVKVLLNRYAIAYRLAERRASEGKLDPDFGARATELAKLVCLQCEFPLFAEDLTVDARLPRFVRMVADGEALPPGVRPDVKERATAYAEGRRVVAELLVETDLGASDRGQPLDERPEPQTGEDETGDQASEDVDEDEAAASRGDDVARKHAQQLVSYLRKTRHVNGPAPDLVYLESAGAGHGIDAVLSDRLERAAIDNDTAEVLALVASAAGEGQGRGALLVLADVVREAQPGLEGRNVVSALMQSIERSDVDLDDAADAIADAVASHLVQAKLAKEDLLGALTLAKASSRDVGPTLLEAVLRHPDAQIDTDIATALIAHAPQVPEELWGRMATATKTALLASPERAAAMLLTIPEDSGRKLLRDVKTPLKQASDAHFAAAQPQDDAAADVDAILDPPPATALASASDVLAEKSPALTTQITTLMLDLDHEEYRNVVSSRLARLAPIADTTLIAAVVRAAHRRVPGAWSRWLDPLDARAVGADRGLGEWVDSLASNLWDRLSGQDPPAPEDAEEAFHALARCAEYSEVHGDVERRVRDALQGAFTTDDVVNARGAALESAERFVAAGLLSPVALADIDLDASAQTLQAAMETVAEGQRAQVNTAVVARVRESAPYASADQLTRIVESAPKAAWLSNGDRASVLMNAATALQAKKPDRSSPLAPADLRALAEAAPDDPSVDDAIALWLGAFRPTPEDAYNALEPLIHQQLPPRTYSALSTFAQRLNGTARLALIDQGLIRAVRHQVHQSFFEAAHLSEVPADKMAGRLIDLFNEAEGTAAQRVVMTVWQHLSPAAPTVSRRLVEAIYVPLIASGDEGLDLALAYFGVVAQVKGIRKPVREALRAAARTDEQQKRVDDRLLEAKWTTKGLFGFGRARDEE